MSDKQEQNIQQAERFVDHLSKLDAGGKARLRRNAGRALHEARDVQRVFFQLIPPELSSWRYDDFFLVATLFAIYPEQRRNSQPFGNTLRVVRQKRTGNDADKARSLDRRFQALLDTDREQLTFRLRQAVRLARSDEAPIDFVNLLLDLRHWEHEDRFIQLRWAKAYFVGTEHE